MPQIQTAPSPADTQACAQACLTCLGACARTEAYCVAKGGGYHTPELLCALQDCASACRVTSFFILRFSPRQALISATCAEVARQCASACRRFPGDAQMAETARLCDAVARACARLESPS